MKKTSILSAVILIVVVVLFNILSIDNSQASSEVKKATTKQVVIFVHGCDNCKNVAYCLGDTWYYSSTCSITLQLEPGFHSICIACPYQKAGVAQFTVIDDGGISQTVDVTVVSGAACDCNSSKKK